MKYEPVQLFKLAAETAAPYVREIDTDVTPSRVVLAAADGSRTERVITYEQHMESIMTAASIMLAESGGVTEARCYNVDDAQGRPTCSPTGPAGPRGVDRGLWQWNSVAWPQITDAMADDPKTATELAYKVSNGFQQWGPWTGSKGLDPNSQPSRTIRALKQYESPTDAVVDTLPGVGALVGWADALGRFLSALISPAFWRRVGIGAAGIALVVLAVVYLNRGNLATVAATVA